jgi:hypothetical protein
MFSAPGMARHHAMPWRRPASAQQKSYPKSSLREMIQTCLVNLFLEAKLACYSINNRFFCYKVRPMENDTAVFYAYDYNPSKCQRDIWVGNATREAIRKGGFYVGELVGWCSHEQLAKGWAFQAAELRN